MHLVRRSPISFDVQSGPLGTYLTSRVASLAGTSLSDEFLSGGTWATLVNASGSQIADLVRRSKRPPRHLSDVEGGIACGNISIGRVPERRHLGDPCQCIWFADRRSRSTFKAAPSAPI